jgi:hypothetical protein
MANALCKASGFELEGEIVLLAPGALEENRLSLELDSFYVFRSVGKDIHGSAEFTEDAKDEEAAVVCLNK